MAISITHPFVSGKSDGVDSTVVQPSNWNEAHTITLAAGKVIGRKAGSAGAAEELPISVDSTGYAMTPPTGTTAQRPASPSVGMFRFNSTTGRLEAYLTTGWISLSHVASVGTTAPTTPAPATGDTWYDTTNSLLKVYNGTTWVTNVIADGSITAAKLATDAVETATIKNLNVTEAKIAADAVTNAKLANMATQTIKGRTTAGTGDPEDLTATQVTAMLNAVAGDSGSGGTKGLVPAPASGDAAAQKFLKADGTWALIPGAPLLSGTFSGGNTSGTWDLSSYTSVYRGFRIEVSLGKATTSGAHIGIQTSENAGSSWATNSGDYRNIQHFADISSVGIERHDKFGNENTALGIILPFIGNAAAYGFKFVLTMYDLNDTTIYKSGRATVEQFFDNGQFASIDAAFVRMSTNAINAIRLHCVGGTMSGKYAIYGIL